MADLEKVIKGVKHCFHGQECCGDIECPYYIEHSSDSCCLEECQENLKADALELLKSKPDIDKIVKELDDTSKQYEPRPFESINWMLRYEGIMIGLEIAQYVVKGEPIPDKF